jgi:outer membrane receptor for ferrienterochelin and colicin/uncharacterized membrane protein YgcG
MFSRATLKLIAILAAALLLPALPISAQTAPATPAAQEAAAPATPAGPAPGTTATTGALRGRAVDPTGAVIPGTSITLTGTHTYTTQSTGDGTYLIPNIAPGVYTVTTQISGFTPYTKANIQIAAGVMAHQNLHLDLEVNTVVTVKADNANQLSVDADSNASSLVLKGKDLDALSDDPDELSDELNALAGPAAGPNGGQIYIDGFTGGTLPPKSSIREIRINQNPFSAEYDKVGFGRIEVFTKPGTDKLHGSFQMQGNDNVFNTAALVGNAPQPPYDTFFFQGQLSGPLSKIASYNIGSNYRVIQDNNVVDTTIAGPGPTFTPTPFIQGVFFPQTRIDLSPRLDLQITPTNTLTARYQFDHNSQTNVGVGGNSLATAGYNSTDNNNELQLSDSQILGSRVVTETHFEYTREASSTIAQNPQQTTSVQGAFTNFGSGTGTQSDVSTHYELQSYTSVALKNHFIRFGGRLRYNGDSNSSTAGFNGTFTYGQTSVTYDPALNTNYATVGYNSASSPCYPGSTAIADVNNIGAPGTPTGPAIINVKGICNYGLTQYYNSTSQTPHANIGPSQFNASYGNPAVAASVVDVGLYAEDDWKVRPNLLLSAGIRYETQNQIGDHHDLAPRLGLNWGVGKNKTGAPLFVVRGGFGIFYDRFALGQVENIARYNGTGEQQVTVSPATGSSALTFNNCAGAIPSCIPSGSLTSASATTYSQSPSLRAPYTMQTAFGVEHQLFKPLTLTATYLNSRGLHQFFAQNLASLPGAPTNTPNNYQYVSQGIFKQSQLIVQGTYRGPHGASLFGFYVFGHANADTSGPGSFPSIPGDIAADYGRSSFDVHQRLFVGGSVPLRYNIALSPFLIASSGTPFNITTGQQNFNIYNVRPAFASAAACAAAVANPNANPNIVVSKYGCFDTTTGTTSPEIPNNYAQGPAQVAFNLRATKTFGFGRKLGRATSAQGGGRNQAGSIPTLNAGGAGGSGGGGGRGGGGGGGGGGGFGGGGGANTGHRYNLTIGAQALNLFNVVNYSTPVGVLSSPQFGQQTRLAGGIYSTSTAVRRITLQMNFTF